MLLEMHRIFKRKVSVLVYLGGLLMLLRPLLVQITSLWRYTFHEIYLAAFATGVFTPFAALFPAVVFAAAFAEDHDSGTIRMCMMRIGRKGYAGRRVMTAIIGGGLMMASYVVLVLIFGAVFAGKAGTTESAQLIDSTLWGRYEILTRYGGAGMYAGKTALAFLFGAVWALFGLVVSALTVNIYIAAIVPLGVYMALWYFLPGSPLNPVYLLRGDSKILPSLGFAFFIQMLAIVCLAVLSEVIILRRVR